MTFFEVETERRQQISLVQFWEFWGEIDIEKKLNMKNDLKRRLERIESFHQKITAFAQREGDKNDWEFNFMVNITDSLYIGLTKLRIDLVF